MRKAKDKTAKVAKKPDYAQVASELRDSFLRKGFTSDQAFKLTLLVMCKNNYELFGIDDWA
jgi:hypothetical protein